MQLLGIHHVTAVAGDPKQNLDFYVGILGLRLVKTTVNFDSPDLYHLYFGDYEGSPGSLLTFFLIPNTRRGKSGAGGFVSLSFSINSSAVDFWVERLSYFDVSFEVKESDYGNKLLGFSDPDGLRIELVTEDKDSRKGYATDIIPLDKAIKAIHSVRLITSRPGETWRMLENILGFRKLPGSNKHTVTGKPGDLLEVDTYDGIAQMTGGAGTIHHVAFRVASGDDQKAFRDKLLAEQYNVSPVMDRKYFQSIYFREPGGALFEIATDPPGMHVDESIEELGSSLVLPEWYEAERKEIERTLPPLDLNLQPHGIKK